MSILATAVSATISVGAALPSLPAIPSLSGLLGGLSSLNSLLSGVQSPLSGLLAAPVNGILNSLFGTLPPISL